MIEKPIAIILGGGITPDGQLTRLSKQRLDKGIELFQKGLTSKLVALGELRSTYFENAIQFDISGAERRAKYLMEHGIPESAIQKIEKGRDTIGEGLASRDFYRTQPEKNFLLVTSEKHMPRALWIFRCLFGGGYEIEPVGVDCGGILLSEEEKEYFDVTQDYFSKINPDNFACDNWHEMNKQLYTIFKIIHDKYHPFGKESEAYYAVRNSK